jgi:hypothetical protein
VVAATTWVTMHSILHGNAGELGKHTILKYLPDKIARFLYGYHDSDDLSLDLPPLELDRSDTNVHGDDMMASSNLVRWTNYKNM